MKTKRRTLVCWLLLIAPGMVSASITTSDPRYVSAIAEAKSSMMTDPGRAVVNATEARRLAGLMRTADQATALATAEWLQAEGLLRLEQPAKAGLLIGAALTRVGGKGRTSALVGDLLVAKGKQSSDSGQMAEALDSYQGAYRVFQNIGDTRRQARALIAIGIIYDEAYDHDGAIRYFRQALETYDGDRLLSYSIYGNIGQTLKEAGRLAEAEEQTIKALALARQIGSPILIGHTFGTLARIHLAQGQLASADHDLAEAMPLIGDEDEEHGPLLATAAQAALQHGRIALAASLIRRSFAGVDSTQTPLAMRERHETAYDVYRAAGNSMDALVHLSAMKRLDDEATRLATSANTALMGARFDFKNQELRIARLKAEEAARNLAYERARARTQQTVFICVIAATAVGIALLTMGVRKLRRSRNEVERTNGILGDTNDALEKALAARTEFLATTSHEIRTPLNGILGMTQVMLADGTVDAAVRERIGIVHQAGMTMRALVDDILDVAKMEAGNLSVATDEINLCGTLGDLAKLWREQARGKGLTFEADLADCPAMVEGDAARVRQVVGNLLGNAVKFTERGGVTLQAAQVPGKPRYRVTVRDTGVGIPAGKHELVFEAFRQGDASTTRRFGGTGLGLAISRRLARAMGGDVTVASEQGRGSTFTLELPLIEAVPAVAAPVAEPEPASAMLVVERNPIARAMYKAMLTPVLGEVTFAASVAEASDRLGRGAVQRLLVDDATARAERPLEDAVATLALAGAPLTLLWSPAAGEDQARLLAGGAASVILKPISRADLLAVLCGHMDQLNAHLDYQAA